MSSTERRRGRSASHASLARSSSSQRTFEPRAMKIDATERRLLKVVEADEWARIARLSRLRRA
jgi:hypothetical protein